MENLNFALIGRGKFGKNYERLLREMPEASLQAVVTSSSGNLQSVLQNSNIHCAVIATPPKTHFKLAKAALEANKHVLLEKPMIINLKEAEELKKIVGNSDRTFMVGFQYLYNDYINYLKKEIQKDALGKMQIMSAEHFQSPERDDVNSFWDAAPHPLSIFQYFFQPTKILNIEIEIATKESTSAKIKFDCGPMLDIKTSWRSPQKIRKITFTGERQTATLDETLEKQKLKFSSGLIPDIQTSEPLKNEVAQFIECVKNKRVPLTDVNFGYKVTEWLEAVCKN